MCIDHSALKYLVNKPVLGGKICWWLLLSQEFDFEIIVNPGQPNVGPYHFSLIESGEEPTSLEDNLPNVQLFAIDVVNKEFDDMIHLLNTGYAPKGYSTWKMKQLVFEAPEYTIIMGKLYKLGPDKILCRCIFNHEKKCIMVEVHVRFSRGIYVEKETMKNILQFGLRWPIIHMDTRK